MNVYASPPRPGPGRERNEDADTADVFVQLCLFDKLVYG